MRRGGGGAAGRRLLKPPPARGAAHFSCSEAFVAVAPPARSPPSVDQAQRRALASLQPLTAPDNSGFLGG